MDRDDGIDARIAQAQRAQAILRDGGYRHDGRWVELGSDLARCRVGTRLIRPPDWDGLLLQAQDRCRGASISQLVVREQSALAALAEEVPGREGGVAILNFASGVHPGGGWDRGAQAQEESLARASGLIASLGQADAFYAANREADDPCQTDNAIWSPAVPFFATDDGCLVAQPFHAGIISMPAPNMAAVTSLSEALLHRLVMVWRRRVRCVLALAIACDVRRLILGAWGCGACANDPVLVARWFREALVNEEPWRRGFDTIVFAIQDDRPHQPCLEAFRQAFPG